MVFMHGNIYKYYYCILSMTKMGDEKMSKKPTMREVQLLGYHVATCPHCKETIFVPEYRIQPGTAKDDIKLREELKRKQGC